MSSTISYHVKSASLCLGKFLVRGAALGSMVVTFGVGPVNVIGSAGLRLLGATGLVIIAGTSVHARCLHKGVWRDDISDNDCLEAQRTGCVRSMLTQDQYISCLRAVAEANEKDCIIGGRVRNDLSNLDCEEAKATGCVRRLLTTDQYQSCLDAQPPKR